ncbi:ferredoxin-type protein NapF [Psychromonas sp. CNPT3]|uniref:ferredoxin-type protein NapF n=1 Tax=Psychromonas sp. CNPT3 TaxID=314282 RepID=UPI00006E4832|nr:ferredoxin-type protein NapF [Psychromonas sp. CNPT3]AGH81240.1 ferredoxin-type protein NapF [Psychromonas sp. CNPT3]
MLKINSAKRSLWRPKKQINKDNLLPWLKDADIFFEQCTQCGDCLSACPTQIIVKGDGGYPKIDFNLGECEFCSKCADICTQPLFLDTRLPAWSKKAQISESCLANKNIYCRSCSDSCEAQALTFQLGISALPTINLDLCNGCGGCVAPCPTQAIIIKE